MQVSCNDWDLCQEAGSAWLQEALVEAEGAWIPGAGFAADQADTWVASAYFPAEPSTLAARQAWQRPWLCHQSEVGLCGAHVGVKSLRAPCAQLWLAVLHS